MNFESQLVKMFSRVTGSQCSGKSELFVRRIYSVPFAMVGVCIFISVFIGRKRSIDSKLSKLPIIDLFFKFLVGNARLISMAELDTFAHSNIEFEMIREIDAVYDVIVIGSGPGGAVAALRAAEHGKTVLVIESGKTFEPGIIEHHSLTQTVNQFRKNGLNFIWGLKPVLFAEGHTFGGGSEVNSGLYHRLEGEHRKRILGSLNVTNEEWTELEKIVEKEIHVQISPNDSKPKTGLVPGAERRGLEVKEIPRWRKYVPEEEHQGMQVTYLKKAQSLGAKFHTNATVQRINPNNSNIEVFVRKGKVEICFFGKEVVLASGTIETPRILYRSKLTKGKIDLNFHPMLRAVAFQNEVINDGDLFPSWQAWTKDLNFKFGYSVSTYPYLSATLPSLGDFSVYREDELSKMAAYFASFVLRDSKVQLVRVGRNLIPFVRWGKADKSSLYRASEEMNKILQEGAAIKVLPTVGISPVTTVHLFGSLPIGKSSTVDEFGRLHKDQRIRISDGSILPHAPWGNPQGAIMVLCELMAKRWREDHE